MVHFYNIIHLCANKQLLFLEHRDDAETAELENGKHNEYCHVRSLNGRHRCHVQGHDNCKYEYHTKHERCQ